MTTLSRPNHTRRLSLTACSTLALLAAAPAAICAPAEPLITFAIPAGTMESVLTTYAIQAHVQLLYTPDLVAGRRSAGLTGALTAREALGRLLSGSGLSAQESRPGVIVLRLGRIAEADPTPELPQPSPEVLSELVVTGSHIRGADPGAAPVLQLDRDALDRRGYATVTDALSALPQNYAGLATPASATTGIDVTTQNYSRATTVNLRALGPDATLVMVNGRRMAGTGGKGDLSDISSIPAAAVERVDVLLDGASALYGSDAVGGVVNLVMKRDFDGAETQLRYGAAQGGAGERLAAQSFGRVWSGGHTLITYEYYARDALPFTARDYTASADLRPFGGTDHRSTNASPGNILVLDPATNTSRPLYAIPAGATTFPLKATDFIAGGLNLQSPKAGMDLLADQERNSVYANFGQSLGERVEVNGDFRFSRRTSNANSVIPTAILSVTPANPYFASPNGATTQQIAYAFANDLGPSQSYSVGRSLAASLGAKLDLWGDWQADGYVAYAKEQTHSGTTGNLNSLFLNEALGTTADNPATTFKTSVDGFYNPYGSGQANSRTILNFIGSGYSRQRFESRMTSLNVQADGKVWTLPGGDLRLALGAQTRRESFDQYQESELSTVNPVVTRPAREGRTVNAAFAELRAPLVGPDNAVPGVRRLEFSLAGRIESYSDAGQTTNPKVGLTWEPAEGFRLRATYGTSFRAPGLTETKALQTISAFPFASNGARLLVLDVDGGNPDLEPETAKSWTAGFDISPVQVPGLKIAATLFDTDFSGQIDRPVFRFLASGLSNPVIAPFVRFVSASNPADLAKVQALISDPKYTTPGLYPASAFNVIIDTRYVNTGRLHVRGLDAQVAYGFDHGADRFDLALSGTYLFNYDQQLTPTASTANFVNIAGQPLALRARGEANWRHGDFGATLGINYAGAYKTSAGQTIDAWTTADLQVRWAPSKSPVEGLVVTASVQNLFDTDPPFYDAPQGIGYDAANADPIGRFAAIQLTKRW
ncbi:TonB-dependent receptor [Phenylobacterium sp.]|uniref:TonB-dependent receptor n=1 Tax=Phenylobacterium sp. TaxID=1871053 RepID=UPI0035B09320